LKVLFFEIEKCHLVPVQSFNFIGILGVQFNFMTLLIKVN